MGAGFGVRAGSLQKVQVRSRHSELFAIPFEDAPLGRAGRRLNAKRCCKSWAGCHSYSRLFSGAHRECSEEDDYVEPE